MRVRLALAVLVGLTLSCQSDPAVSPTAPRDARPAAAAGAVVPTPVPLPTATPVPTPTPTAPSSATPTPVVIVAATATPTPRAVLTPTPTPAPRPTSTPSDPFCLDLATVPSEPVPVFTGRGCRMSEGFVPVLDPMTNAVGCVRNWRCADGDERYQPVVRIGASLNRGGPEGVHRCNAGEGLGPEFICDTGRAGQDAYGRNVLDNGAIIQPAREPDGRLPGPWERAGICRPVICGATP